ncbi:MAG: hypothetical protein FDZ72_12235 [Betaproteobacteria bacterium]|nr:MAG: hypothetical protein FDZ72_12235 [Betaproteobacteria bacterium]
MKYCSSKDFDSLIRLLLRQGWSFSRGAKHGKLRPPDGYPVLTVPSSPSDRRALLNFCRDIRHCGYVLASSRY